MKLILENLKSCKNRTSTMHNYLGIWRRFNCFIQKLDVRPKLWEDRVSLFCAYLVDQGIQSSTLRSYISAIKGTLIDDGYPWDDNLILVRTLSRACKLINDRVRVRLPISSALLDILLFEVERVFKLKNQYYLEIMYKAFFSLSYYGLFRIGELATGSHPIRAKDVHIAQNKNKMLFVLYSSKTHNEGARPQKVKISANTDLCGKAPVKQKARNFCPFKCSREYLAIRENYNSDQDPFFVNSDQSPVTPNQV